MDAGFQSPSQRDGCHNCKHLAWVRWHGAQQDKVAMRCGRHEVEVSKHSICDQHDKGQRL